MADKTVAQENPAGTLTGAELVRIVQGGNSVRTTAQAIANLSASGTEAIVAGLINAATPGLRRAVNGQRKDNTAALSLALSIFDGAKGTNTDGNLTTWQPDASHFYGAMWTRDVSIAIENYIDYFAADEIAAIATYILGKSNLTTGEVPDHILNDGTVHWLPGSGSWGARAPIDGQLYLTQLFWLHYLSSGNASLYNAHKTAIKNLVENGISYNSTTKAVTIPLSGYYVGFGFYDTAIISGDNAFCTILAYRAYVMLSEMEFVLGNILEAERLFNRALDMQQAVYSMLIIRDGSGAELLTPYFARKMAYLPVSSGNASGQIDLWASAYAVWSGVLTEGQEKDVANFLLYAYKSSPDNVVHGGIRTIYKPTDFVSNAQCWPAYISEPTYGTYQNGGYWPIATPWYIHTLNLISPADAVALYKSVVDEFTTTDANAPYEWWNSAETTFGAAKYLASVAPMLEQGDMPYVPVSTGAGDIVATLSAPEASITGTTTISDFGVMHVCSGTAADYTVTLPTAAGNAGKMVGVRMSYALTRLVTIATQSAQTIDASPTRIMWAGESAILMSDGSNWIKIAGKSLPMSVTMKLTASTAVPPGWNQVVMDSTVDDTTSALAVPMADLGNGRARILRPGRYTASGFCSITGATSGIEFNAGVVLNNATPGDNPNAFVTCPVPASGNAQTGGTGTFSCSAGDWIATSANRESVGGGNTRAIGSVYPTLSVQEIVSW